jgi:hypothetical protein
MSRHAVWLAGGLLGLYLGLESLALVLSIRSGQHDDAILGLGTLALAAVGALVASRRAGNPIGWIMLAIANLWAFSGLGEGYFVASPDPASLPLGTAMLWVSQWITWVWLGLAVVFLPLLFPDGKLPSPKWRPVPWVAGIAIGLAVAGDAFRPGRLEADDPAVFVENPLGVGGGRLESALGSLRGFATALFAASLAAAVAAVVVRLRRARGDERQQLKWFAYVAALMATGFAVAALSLAIAAAAGWDENDLPTWLGAVGTAGWMTGLFGLVIALPLAIGVAVLRYRLYDIDVVINRTLVYGAVTALLAGAYLGLVLLFQLAFSPLTEENSLAVALSTLAVAALFRPARNRVQAVVDRRFYRRRYDAQQTLEGFTARLREEVDLDALRAELTGVVGDTMQPAHVSLWLREVRS